MVVRRIALMLEALLVDHLRGRRLAVLIAAGCVLEVIVVLVSRHLGSSQLIGIHGVLAIAVAIAVAIAGGAVAGAIVGGVGAVLFVMLIAYAQPDEPHWFGVPVVALWCGLAAGTGAAVTALRRAADRARSLAVDTADRTQALHRAVGRLAVSATPDEVARIAIVEGTAALGAHGAWLALMDERHSALDYVASSGFAEDWIERFQAIPLTHTTAATDVVRDGQARFFADADAMAAAYPANAAAYRDVDIQATAVVPLARGSVPIGMMAFHWRQPHSFSAAERDVVRTFADTAAQALERARLYSEVRGTAEALQRSLLPTFLPTFPDYEIAVRYRPTSETLAVGGDWYDVVEAHHGQIGIAVGDVGGKGIDAAAIMGRLRTAMRAYADRARRTVRGVASPRRLPRRDAAGRVRDRDVRRARSAAPPPAGREPRPPDAAAGPRQSPDSATGAGRGTARCRVDRAIPANSPSRSRKATCCCSSRMVSSSVAARRGTLVWNGSQRRLRRTALCPSNNSPTC